MIERSMAEGISATWMLGAMEVTLAHWPIRTNFPNPGISRVTIGWTTAGEFHRLDGPAIYEFTATNEYLKNLKEIEDPTAFDSEFELERIVFWMVRNNNIHMLHNCRELPYLFPRFDLDDLILWIKQSKSVSHGAIIADELGLDIGNLVSRIELLETL